MNLNEKAVSTEYIFRGKIINLRLDSVKLPNGRPAEREIVEHPGGVAVVAVTENDEIIMVRQYRRAADEVLYEIPAGKLNWGEDHYSCGVRELEEETGYLAGKFEYLGGFYPTPGFCNEVIHIYLATDLTKGDSNPDEDEFLEICLEKRESLVQKIMAGEIKDSKTVIGILMASRKTAGF